MIESYMDKRCYYRDEKGRLSSTKWGPSTCQWHV
jgi:hypothetical protein